MTDNLSKDQMRRLQRAEQRGRERWEAMNAEERNGALAKFLLWFNRRLESELNVLSVTYETVLEDAHVKARNLGLHADPQFQTTWAGIELDLRKMIEEE